MAPMDPRLVDPAEVAPEAMRAFDVVRASARAAVDPVLYDLARARIGTVRSARHPPPRGGTPPPVPEKLAALPSCPPSPLFTERERAGLAFAEQFVLDVSAVS